MTVAERPYTRPPITVLFLWTTHFRGGFEAALGLGRADVANPSHTRTLAALEASWRERRGALRAEISRERSKPLRPHHLDPGRWRYERDVGVRGLLGCGVGKVGK